MNYIQSHTDINPEGLNDEMAKIFIDSTAVLRLSDCFLSSTTYTLQFWIKSSSNFEVELSTNGLHKIIDSSTNWTKYVYTFTPSQITDNAIYFKFTQGIYYLYHVKLEYGDVATSWTPNESDIVTTLNDSENTESLLYRLNDKYCDKLGSDNGLWYIERNTELLTLDGTEEWWDDNGIFGLGLTLAGEAWEKIPALCSHFSYSELYYDMPENHFNVFNEDDYTYICIKPASSIASNLTAFKTWLGSNPITVLLPATEQTTTVLANYLQLTLNTLSAKDDLKISFANDTVHSLDVSVLTEPLVFGTVNSDNSVVVNNMSDSEIGFIYQIYFKGETRNPAIHLSETNEYLKLNGLFIREDVVTIDTRRGKKSVTKTHYGTETNIINSLDNSSKWLQLRSGYNHITQSAQSGINNMESIIVYTKEYQGV